MFETLLDAFQGSPLALWGPLVLLLLCGLGLPVPEDIVLIAAGALGEMEGRSWLQVSVVMYLGVIGGDLYFRQIPRGNVIFGGGQGRANADHTRSRPLPEIAASAGKS